MVKVNLEWQIDANQMTKTAENYFSTCRSKNYSEFSIKSTTFYKKLSHRLFMSKGGLKSTSHEFQV